MRCKYWVENMHPKNISMTVKQNNPTLWKLDFPKKNWKTHKYKHGHTLVIVGVMLGAGIMASLSALRGGAGLVTVICYPKYKAIFSLVTPSIIVVTEKDPINSEVFQPKLKYNSIIFGPGTLPTKLVRNKVKFILNLKIPTELDVGAISAFEGHKDELLEHLHEKVVSTPHFGEFKSILPEFKHLSTIKASLFSSEKTNAVVLLKGANTTISDPTGMQILSSELEASYLATARSGDILSGTISGLISQGMEPLKAAAATNWLVAYSAKNFGPGMISGDLLTEMPRTISKIIY